MPITAKHSDVLPCGAEDEEEMHLPDAIGDPAHESVFLLCHPVPSSVFARLTYITAKSAIEEKFTILSFTIVQSIN